MDCGPVRLTESPLRAVPIDTPRSVPPDHHSSSCRRSRLPPGQLPEVRPHLGRHPRTQLQPRSTTCGHATLLSPHRPDRNPPRRSPPHLRSGNPRDRPRRPRCTSSTRWLRPTPPIPQGDIPKRKAPTPASGSRIHRARPRRDQAVPCAHAATTRAECSQLSALSQRSVARSARGPPDNLTSILRESSSVR